MTRHSSVKNAVLALSNTSNAFGSAAAASAGRQTGINGEDEVLKKIAIEEEEAILEQLKDRRLKELGTSSDGSSGSATNPFLSSPGAAEANNLFGSPPKSTTTSASKAYEDLLCLANSNPFADTLAGKPANAPPTNNFWGDQNGFSSTLSSTSFVPETSFNAVFGAAPTGQQGFDAFGDILMPVSSTTVTSSTTTATQPKQQSKVITGDLDSSLASLVQNLDINRSAGAMQKGGSMWNSPKNTAKTGGANWTPQVASSTGPSWNSPQHTPYQPMGQTAVTGKPADWSSGLMAGHFPQGGSQGVTAPFGSNPVPTQQFPRGFVGTMGPATGLQQQRFPQPSQPQQPTLDPFGAL